MLPCNIIRMYIWVYMRECSSAHFGHLSVKMNSNFLVWHCMWMLLYLCYCTYCTYGSCTSCVVRVTYVCIYTNTLIGAFIALKCFHLFNFEKFNILYRWRQVWAYEKVSMYYTYVSTYSTSYLQLNATRVATADVDHMVYTHFCYLCVIVCVFSHWITTLRITCTSVWP